MALPLLLVGPGTELIAVTLFDLWQNGQVTELAAMGVLWVELHAGGERLLPFHHPPLSARRVTGKSRRRGDFDILFEPL